MQAFQAKSGDFNVKFKTEGPSCVGSDLDKGQLVHCIKAYQHIHVQLLSLTLLRLIYVHVLTGVKLLKEYQALYSECEAQRGELTNAEKLFDLPITGYPHLQEVEKELKNLALVFELYEAQRVCIVALADA